MVLGREGMIRVGEYSTLAANYLLKRLEAIGCQAAYPERRASHEFILTFAKQAKDNHVTALDIAKRLLDYNQHAPTIYFPLLVPECFLIEPTETETKEAMDDFIDAMAKILEEANAHPETITLAQAAHHLGDTPDGLVQDLGDDRPVFPRTNIRDAEGPGYQVPRGVLEREHHKPSRARAPRQRVVRETEATNGPGLLTVEQHGRGDDVHRVAF